MLVVASRGLRALHMVCVTFYRSLTLYDLCVCVCVCACVHVCVWAFAMYVQWFLNAFWEVGMEAEAETFWEYVQEIVNIDIENRSTCVPVLCFLVKCPSGCVAHLLSDVVFFFLCVVCVC
jgi:hypothetical protein